MGSRTSTREKLEMGPETSTIDYDMAGSNISNISQIFLPLRYAL